MITVNPFHLRPNRSCDADEMAAAEHESRQREGAAVARLECRAEDRLQLHGRSVAAHVFSFTRSAAGGGQGLADPAGPGA